MQYPITYDKHSDPEQDTVSVSGERALTTPELLKVREIAMHHHVNSVAVKGRNDEGILVVEARYATGNVMPYHFLYVSAAGKVASAMLNQPVYFDRFTSLVQREQDRQEV